MRLTVAARAAVAVALIVADTPLPAIAVSRFAPATCPRVQRVRAMPFTSVVAFAGSTVPPWSALNVTVAPDNGWLSLPDTMTSIGSGKTAPAGPC